MEKYNWKMKMHWQLSVGKVTQTLVGWEHTSDPLWIQSVLLIHIPRSAVGSFGCSTLIVVRSLLWRGFSHFRSPPVESGLGRLVKIRPSKIQCTRFCCGAVGAWRPIIIIRIITFFFFCSKQFFGWTRTLGVTAHPLIRLWSKCNPGSRSCSSQFAPSSASQVLLKPEKCRLL